MLDQVIQWMQSVGTIFDGLLLCRVLGLRLHRIYAFITLYCVLTLLFDITGWYLGWNSQANARVEVYSFFLLAIIAPLVAWDVFEEIKQQIAKLRRLHAARLVSGILMSAVFAFVLSLFLEPKDASGNSEVTAVIGIFFWSGSCSASLAFMWYVYRNLTSQKFTLPNNTFVWAIFYMLTLILSIVECGFELFGSLLANGIRNSIWLALICFDLALTAWCIFRLRAASSQTPANPPVAS